MPKAFVVAAPHSGAGKTTVTLALLAAFRARGLAVQAFKAGPDYIDPAHHARLTGRPTHNHDSWMLPLEVNTRIFDQGSSGADVSVVEGVMGLYDGVDGVRPEGSTAHIALLLDLPVVLVVDARSMARSAAALVQGFSNFEPGVRIAGVIWNRVGSPSHRRILDEALASAGLAPSLGALPRDSSVSLPERHLGLVTPEDAGLPDHFARSLARFAEDHVALDELLRIAGQAVRSSSVTPAASAGGIRIGVPRDAAFCFYYEENLRLLRQEAGEVVFFRPTDGDGVPPDLDGLYLGGGYPEAHAQKLSRNEAFLSGIRELHRAGRPIYAECGGFMALCREMEDLEGNRRPMAGIFPVTVRMDARGFRLGYREVRVEGVRRLHGLVARGHEFHYSRVETMPEAIRRAYRVWNARGEELEPEGYVAGNTLAGYIHLHFGSNPAFVRGLFAFDG